MEYLGRRNLPEDIVNVIDRCLAEFRLDDVEAATLLDIYQATGEIPEHVRVVEGLGFITVNGVVHWLELNAPIKQQPMP